jgi:hypothetical protein
MSKFIAAGHLVFGASFQSLLPRVVTLLGEALKILRIEEQLGISTVRNLVVYHICSA